MSIRKSLRSACGEECNLDHIGDGEHHRHRPIHHMVGNKMNLSVSKRTPGSHKKKDDYRERKTDVTEYIVHTIADSGKETNQLGSIFLDDEFADLSFARSAIQYAKFPSSPDNFQFVSNIGTPIDEEYETKKLVSGIADKNNCILINQAEDEDNENSEDDMEQTTEIDIDPRATTFSEGFKRLYGDRGREIIERAKEKVKNMKNSDYNSNQGIRDEMDQKSTPNIFSEEFERQYGNRGRDIIKKAKEKVRIAKQGTCRPSRRYDSLDRLYERMNPREDKDTSLMWRVIKQNWLPMIVSLLLLLVCVYYFDYLKRSIVGGNVAVVAVMISSLLFYAIVSLCQLVICRIFPGKFDEKFIATVVLLVVLFPVFACMFLMIFSFAINIFEKTSGNGTNLNSTEDNAMADTYFSSSF